jgi:hypothetical protein
MPHFRRIDMLLRQIVTPPVTHARALLLNRAAFVALVLAMIACERPRAAPPIDSAVPLRPAAIGSASPQATTTWDAHLGPVLLIAGATPDLATVVVGDSAHAGADTITTREAIAIRSTPATLVGRTDSVQLGILQEVRSAKGEDDSECTGWPAWAIQSARNGGTLAGWTVGFVGAAVQPIHMDSIESMTRVDSARLAAEVTRLASTLPTSASDRFTGLPFTVTSLWRFHAGPGAEGIVTNLVRHINQEARPFEERTLIIAERDSSRREERFTLGYYDRSQGAEETVESRDVLALARPTPDAQPMLVLGRDYGDGMSYALVQRDPSGRWREKWHSPRGHCK